MKFLTPILLICFLLGCADSADEAQREETAAMASEANAIHGMPQITRFTERGLFKNIYELRDDEILTFSYIIDMNGGAHFLCNSIGYGIPYSAQYVNPEKRVRLREFTIPQPEPNGLFMPTSSSATWITCAVEGQRRVIYVEPEIIVSPFELDANPMR